MKKLPQVLLVLTVIALGVMYGGYRFRLDRGEAGGGFTAYVHATLKGMGSKLAGTKKETPKEKIKFSDDSSGCLDQKGGWDFQKREENEKPPVKEEVITQPVEQHEKKVEKKKKPSFQTELDEIDLLMNEASIYLNIATIKVELRNEYAKKAYDCTTKALDIFELFSEETQNRPEFQQRLKTITEVRHTAIKLAPMDK